MKRVMGLVALFILVMMGEANARPCFRLSVVCFGSQPDCPRSMKVAYEAARLLSSQIDADLKIVSAREVDLPEIDPRLEVIMAQPMAMRIHEIDWIDLVLFISPRADYNILGVSYLGVIGVRPAATISHMPFFDKIAVDVVAHEIAHAFGASHDTEGLMTPGVLEKTHSSRLSDRSKQEIKEHLDRVLMKIMFH